MDSVDQINKSIVFFDGVCNLCNTSVAFILTRDKRKRFVFSSLQSDKAKQVLSKKHVEEGNLNSIILLQDDIVYEKSTAVLKIASRLSGVWPIFKVFLIIPQSLRDAVYDWVAKNRYKWFGKKDSCMIPSESVSHRFL